jgi:type I restriction enzyme, S subunit
MKVSKGFKQTEIGEIPEDWEVAELGHIGHFKNGINKSSEDFGFGYPFVNLMDVFGKSSIKDSTALGLINSNDFEKKLYNLSRGDVLFVRSSVKPSGVGLTCVVESDLKNTVFSGFIIRFRDENMMSVEFKRHCFYNERFRKTLIGNSTVSANTNINQDALKKLRIPLPPLKEQQAIAEVLSDMDRMISQTEALIEKKKAIKQGMMQELLRPKDGWEKVKLGDCIKVSRGGSPRPIQEFITTNSNGVNWIKIGDTDVYSKFIVSSVEKIIQEGIPYSRKVYSGDLLLSNSMSFGRPYILKIDGCIHDGWLVLQDFGDSFNLDFLYYLLSSKYVFNQYLNLASGSSVLNLNKELVKKIDLIKPKLMSEQQHIATVISDIDSQIETITEKHQKLKLQKQGMMQALLTGRIRLT